jgi:tryptophan 2,3-dioxygenase
MSDTLKQAMPEVKSETGSEQKRGGYPRVVRSTDETEQELGRVLGELKARYGDRLIDTLEADLLRREITYDDYIETTTLLSLQQTLTDHHDELIFKVYHQQTELWFRLSLHEIERAIRCLVSRPADIATAIESVSRVNRYFAVLSYSFNVLLDGLSSDDFLEYRKAFGTSSGFQSSQFRAIEILAGLEREAKGSGSHESRPAKEREQTAQQSDDTAMFYWERAARHLTTNEPTLTLIKFKEQHLARLNEMYRTRQPHSLRFAFAQVVSERLASEAPLDKLSERLFQENKEADLIQLAEELLKLDREVIGWKQMHLKVAAKHLARAPRGTGETNWAEYLARSIAEQRCFPELKRAKDLTQGA